MVQKLRNKEIIVDGIKFQSKREAHRYTELKQLERAGYISDLELQKTFELIPAQYKNGKCVERACKYIADFVYKQDGETIVEDSKGYRNPSSATYAKFVIKRKLMLYIHNIVVKEV